MARQKTVIVVAGPTAVGKTGVGIAIARRYGTEIISADSRQCYHELNIGVARPSPDELAAVKHHFIASHSIHDKLNAAGFEQYALDKVKKMFLEHDVVVMVGGTGLYIKAFCEGLDDIPEVPGIIHQEIITAYKIHGIEWLQQQLQELDSGFYQQAEQRNPQRLMRALEVLKATGRSITSFQKGQKAERDFHIIKLALDLPRQQLYQQINQRVDTMTAEGLVEEARSLIPYAHLNALQTVGYKELFDYFAGEILLPEAIERIKQNTRHYAKRQLTWFRKDKDYNWFAPYEIDQILGVLDQTLLKIRQ